MRSHRPTGTSLGATMFLGVFVAGCHPTSLPPPTHAGPASDRLPSLQLHHASHSLETSPRYMTSSFAIGPQGTIVFPDNTDGTALLTLIDSTDRVLSRLARRGEGPGEALSPMPIDVSDSSVTISDIFLGRNTIFRLDGTLVMSRRSDRTVVNGIGVPPGKVLTLISGPRGMRPVLVTLQTGQTDELLARPDSFISTTFATVGLPGQPKIPILGRWSEGFIIGDGWTYRLGLYGWDGVLRNTLGRDLPPPQLTPARIQLEFNHDQTRGNARLLSPAAREHELEVIASRRQPQFPHTRHLGMDGQGRIWVVGIAGDSAFADLFNSRGFLGRIALPCRGYESGWSVNGDWFALVCAPDDPAFEGDAVFKVFRLVDR